MPSIITQMKYFCPRSKIWCYRTGTIIQWVDHLLMRLTILIPDTIIERCQEWSLFSQFAFVKISYLVIKVWKNYDFTIIRAKHWVLKLEANYSSVTSFSSFSKLIKHIYIFANSSAFWRIDTIKYKITKHNYSQSLKWRWERIIFYLSPVMVRWYMFSVYGNKE